MLMNTKQILVCSASVLIGIAIYLAPRTTHVEKQDFAGDSPTNNQEFISQLESVKKETNAAALASIKRFEDGLKSAKGNDQLRLLDSLAQLWDSQMRPGIAAEYVFRKAEITKNAADWYIAGERYLGLSRFFGEQEKQALVSKAVNCLEKAKQLDPRNNSITTQLGVAYVELGQDPMKGILLLREAVASDSTNAEAHLNLGYFSMQSGQFDKAVARFQKVIALRPGNPEIYLYLSDALTSQGKKEEAIAALKKLNKLTTDTLLLKESNSRLQQIKQN
jgi:tetratricopeptide (TPR) repeat protein